VNLLSRLFVFNFAGAALVTWAWMRGYVDMLTAADATHMTAVISGLFGVGLASVGWRAWALSRAASGGIPSSIASAFRARRDARKLAIRNEHIGDIVESLVILGLVGNAVGFLIGFRGVDAGTFGSAEGLREGGAHLLAGVGTAFGSTIAGLSMALWTLWNNRMLATATALYAEDLN
jgi:hypothetical protein